jgi:hypothetical protein
MEASMHGKSVWLVLPLLVGPLCSLCAAASSFPGEVYSLPFEDGIPWARKHGSNVQMAIDTRQAHGGKASLRLSAGSQDREHNLGELGHGPMAVKPSTEYVLSCWVKGDEVVTQGAQMGVLNQAVPQLPDGGSDWKAGTYHVAGFPAGTYDWRKVELRFKTTAAQDTLWARILFNKGSGTVWLDDLRLTTAAAYAAQGAVSAILDTPVGRQRFLPGEKIPVLARMRNNEAEPVAVNLEASLKEADRAIATKNWSGRLAGGEMQSVPLFTWDSAHHRIGDYPVHAEVRIADQKAVALELPLKLCRLDRPDFFWSMWISPHPDAEHNRVFYARLKQYDFAPTYAGHLLPEAMDLLLEYGLPFSARLGIAAHFAEKKGAQGETWKHALGTFGLSDAASWEEGGRLMEEYIRTAAPYPGFSRWVTTSDDFSVVGGWDWAEENRKRFREQTGMEAPVPPAFARGKPPYADAGGELAKRPPGVVSERDPWLLWCRFLSKDVLGRYNGALQKGAERGMRSVRVGPVSGGMQWPLFHPTSGQYPPYTFGPDAFHLLSFYYYLSYWQPSLGNVYWTEIARMGNRDYPVLCLADSLSPMRHYTRNTFYLILAGGAQGINYFTYSQTHPKFWEEVPALARMIRENGPVVAQLRPARRPVGYLVSFTTAAFNPEHPVTNLNGYANLLNAHVDAEPICEEEVLSGWISRYDTLILSDIRWLTPSVAQKLQEFIRRGKTVYVDSKTAVPLSGASRLNFHLGEGGTFAYGNPAQVAKIRAALLSRARPWADSDDPWLVLRSFEAGGARYCWAVNVENAAEYKTFRRKTMGWPREQKLSEAEWSSYEQQKNLVDGSYTSSLTLPAGGYVYDVLGGKALPARASGNRRQYAVTMPKLGGTLLMLLPRPIARLTATGPESLKRGTSGEVEVRLLDDQGRAVAGVVPIALRIRRGEGPPEVIRAAASGGAYRLPLEVPINDEPGMWKIEASTPFLSAPPPEISIRIE